MSAHQPLQGNAAAAIRLVPEPAAPPLDEPARPERRLWRIDLNDVQVIDELGHAYAVTETKGVLNGSLTVTITSEDVPLHVAENLADALEESYNALSVKSQRALAAYRAAIPKAPR